MQNNGSEIQMKLVTDADELVTARSQRERFDRNVAWLQNNASQIYSQHRGKCICVAGGEVFVGATSEEAVAAATAAHPEDNGRFVQYVPKDRVPRIYAHSR